MNSNTKDKTILFIVHNYNSFQKDPIEETAKYFKKVYVLVRYKPFSRIIKYIPIKRFQKYDDSFVIDRRNIPDNVEVIKTPVWYLPFNIFYKYLGKMHLNAVEKAIKHNNIKFNLVHSHFLWSAGYVGMKLKEKYKVPFVVTGQGYDVYKLPFESEDWKDKIYQVAHSANKVLTVSKKNKEYLLSIGIRENSVSIIGHGYNPKLFFPIKKEKARKLLRLDINKKILLCVGNLEEVKGHRYLIQAVSKIIKEYPYLLCYILGGGALYKDLQKMINNLNLRNNVFLMGHTSHDQINKWINSCDAFVLPSISESFGVVQIEAFACGKPVVATMTEGSKEIITSDRYGLLCDIMNPLSLANKIESVLSTSWNDKEIQDYAKSFTLENISLKVLKIYNELLD